MSPENFTSIIEKIKKLFALGKSANEHEAALAMERARSMMLKYNIEQSDLAKNEIEDIIEIDFALNSKFNTPATTLAYWIGKGFNIKPIIIKTSTGYHKSEKKIRFIGTISDIAAGTYVYGYILNLINIKSKEYFEQIRWSKSKWTPSGSKKAQTDYSYGFVNTIAKQLEAMEKEREIVNPYEVEVEKALVVVKNANIDKYIKDTLGKVKSSNTKVNYNREHYSAGAAEGSKHGIHKGVDGKSENQLAIGA